MRILLTGPFTFIGSGILSKLVNCEKVQEIKVIGNMPTNISFPMLNLLTNKKVSFYEGSILDGLLLKEIIKEGDIIIHCEYTSKEASHNELDAINHRGSAIISMSARQKVSKFITIVEFFKKTMAYSSYYLSIQKGVNFILNALPENAFVIKSSDVFGITPSFFCTSLNKIIVEALLTGKIEIMGNPNELRKYTYFDWIWEEVQKALYGESTQECELSAKVFPITAYEIVNMLENLLLKKIEVRYVNYWQNLEDVLPGYDENEKVASFEEFSNALKETVQNLI